MPHLSAWVYIMGLAVTINCLLAWSSRSHGAKCLCMWIGSGYALGTIIEVLGRAYPTIELWGANLFGFPIQQAILSVVDLVLLAWLFKIIRANKDLQTSQFWLLGLQFASLTSHWIDVSTHDAVSRLYYGALDALVIAMMLINFRISFSHGLDMDVLLLRHRPVSSRGRLGD